MLHAKAVETEENNSVNTHKNEIIFLDISNETKIEILPLNAICKKEIIQEENASEENP